MSARLSNPIEFDQTENLEDQRGGNIILVDDFITTGHTVRAAAKTLKLSGALSVHVFALGVRPLQCGEQRPLGESG